MRVHKCCMKTQVHMNQKVNIPSIICRIYHVLCTGDHVLCLEEDRLAPSVHDQDRCGCLLERKVSLNKPDFVS